jgi:hypothetical protein
MQAGEGARAFGPALDALLTYLGAPGASAAGLARLAASAGGAAAAGPRFPCVRVLAFVSGAPDAGAGALEGARWADAAPMLFPPGSSGTPTAAVLEAAMAAADALAAPQTEFYAEAGARAAVRAGVLSRCDCALVLHVLHFAARALCAHAKPRTYRRAALSWTYLRCLLQAAWPAWTWHRWRRSLAPAAARCCSTRTALQMRRCRATCTAFSGTRVLLQCGMLRRCC